MKLTNNQMNLYAFSLQKIFDKTQGKLSYLVSKNYRKLVDELQEYEDIRNNTIKKYGELNQETGQYQINIKSDSFKDFVTEMKPYDEIECEVDILMAKPEDLYSSTLTAQEMMDIDFMIDDKENDNGTE